MRLALKPSTILIALSLFVQAAHAQAPQEPPVGGTTVVDRLQLAVPGDIRTTPQIPATGAWGLVLGQPVSNDQGGGIQIDATGQAIVYPTQELLAPKTGTIEFSVLTEAATDDALDKVLLDTLPVNGRFELSLAVKAGVLTLRCVGEDGKIQTAETKANWAANTSHRLNLSWDDSEVSLLINNRQSVKIAKAALAAQEPLALILGNRADFNAPAHMAFSDMRLSTVRDRKANGNYVLPAQTGDADTLAIATARGYQRRLYPVLERLRTQKVPEVPIAYAIAQADVGDVDRALQTIAPIIANSKSPLYTQAIFLRSDLLMKQGDFNGAFDQLQVLTTNNDASVAVRAQVRQAAVLFDQGNKQDSMKLLGQIIAKYAELPDINEAYLMIGLDRFHAGSFQEAYSALNFIGKPGAKPLTTTPIGVPLEIKVADPDLTVRMSDAPLTVVITTKNGDKESALLRPAFSRGVYVGSIDTALGVAKPGDKILQLVGGDQITVTYQDILSSGTTNNVRTVSLGVATDARLAMVSLSALSVYKEVQKYQAAQLITDDWKIVAALPETASSFFRDPTTGLLRPKGFKLDSTYVSNIKPGQSVYVELNDPDSDTTNAADTVTVQLATPSGAKMPATLTETGPHTGIFQATASTVATGNTVAGALLVTMKDAITASYTDPTPAQGTLDPLHTATVTIKANTGVLTAGLEMTGLQGEQVLVPTYRISGNNSKVLVKVEDRDDDTTDNADTVSVALTSPSGTPMVLKLTETGTHTGIFSGRFTLTTNPAAPAAADVYKTKSGEITTISYVDKETPEGTEQTRTTTFMANVATDATIKFMRRVSTPRVPLPGQRPSPSAEPIITYEETNVLTPGNIYRIDLNDADIIPSPGGNFEIYVILKSSTGQAVSVPLRPVKDKKTNTITFQGSFFPRLGDYHSPPVAYVSQTGDVLDSTDADATSNDSLPALNLQGGTTVTANYLEPITADGRKNVARVFPLRVATDAQIALLNLQGAPLPALKPGLSFELQITDGDGDTSIKRDSINATITAGTGDKLNVTLLESDIHSGIFTALVKTAYGATTPTDSIVQVNFAGDLKVTYNDATTVAGTPAVRTLSVTAAPMADTEAVAFTKVYQDPKFEMETLVRLGESLYAVGAAQLATSKIPEGQPRTNKSLQDGARLLHEIIDRFPASEYVPESLFLIGKIRREEHKYDEAQTLFNRVIEDYSDNADLVPQALYQMVLLSYARNDINAATESAIKLVYGYPKNPLVADAFLRIAEYYYSQKDYGRAGYIYKRLLDRFPDAPKADLITYRMATAYYRAGVTALGDNGDGTNAVSPQAADALNKSGKYYLQFAANYPDSELADDAMFWAADCAMKLNQQQRAYTILQKQILNYPTGDKFTAATSLRDEIKMNNPTFN